jgi:hypothetical protein
MSDSVDLPSCGRDGRRDSFMQGPVPGDQRDANGTHGSGLSGTGAIGMSNFLYSVGLIIAVVVLIVAIVAFSLVMVSGVALCS